MYVGIYRDALSYMPPVPVLIVVGCIRRAVVLQRQGQEA